MIRKNQVQRDVVVKASSFCIYFKGICKFTELTTNKKLFYFIGNLDQIISCPKYKIGFQSKSVMLI